MKNYKKIISSLPGTNSKSTLRKLREKFNLRVDTQTLHLAKFIFVFRAICLATKIFLD